MTCRWAVWAENPARDQRAAKCLTHDTVPEGRSPGADGKVRCPTGGTTVNVFRLGARQAEDIPIYPAEPLTIEK